MARTDYGAILSTKIADTSQAIRDVNGTTGLIAPADWGTLIRAMRSAEDYENALSGLEQKTVSGSIVSFADGIKGVPVKSLIVDVNPVQSGTGDPSPDNVRPITPRTSATVTHTGVNQWNEEWESGSIIPASGVDVANANKIRTVGIIPVKPNTSYRIVFNNVESGSDYLYYYKADGTFISSYGYTHTASGSQVFTTPNDCYGFRFIMSTTTYSNNVSVNYPSTDTAYHAYVSPATYTKEFTACYGGKLNLTTGALEFRHGMVDLSTLAWTLLANRARTNSLQNVIKKPVSAANVCGAIGEQCHEVPATTSLNTLGQFAVDQNGTLIFYRDNNTPSGILVYPLADPYVALLTKEEIKTLLGGNTFYADTGDVEVVYYANANL